MSRVASPFHLGRLWLLVVAIAAMPAVALAQDPEGLIERPRPKPAPVQPAPPGDNRLRLPQGPTGDYSFIEGCWRTDPFRHHDTQVVYGVSTYCFDVAGRGNFEWRRGTTICRQRAQARFEGSMLRLRDGDTTCNDGTGWIADHLDCRRDRDGVASCSGASYHPGGQVTTWTVNLHKLN